MIAVHWIDLLHTEAGHCAPSSVSDKELRAAALEVGAGPMQWALQVGHEFAEKVSEEFPEFGQNSPAFAAVRSATQSTVLAMLPAVRSGVVRDDSMTHEARDSIRVAIELGIDLATTLAGMRRGHALTVERLMQECRTLAPPEELPGQFALISEIGFDFAGQLTDGLTRLYLEEQRQWRDSPRAEQLALVARIRDGHESDLSKAAAVLRYEINYRHHIAVCVWYDQETTNAGDELEAVALRFLRAQQATQTLVTRQPDSTVLAWGNSSGPLLDSLAEGLNASEGVRLAVGTPGRDLDGFRTSASDAREAQAIVKRLPGLYSVPVAYFSQLSLIGLLSSDVQRALQFVQTELGALADFDDHDERILETLEAYLDSHSPQTVAHQLFIARNTVTYRLRKAEELLGRAITDRQPQLRAAILLARAFRTNPPAG